MQKLHLTFLICSLCLVTCADKSQPEKDLTLKKEAITSNNTANLNNTLDSVLQDAKYRVIKDAVWFYSTDLISDNDERGRINDCIIRNKNGIYDSLIECSKTLPLVPGRISKWRDLEITSREKLKELIDTIRHDMLSARPGRQENPNYDVLKSRQDRVYNNTAANIDKIKRYQVNAVEPATTTDAASENKKPEDDKLTSLGFDKFWLLLSILLSLVSMAYAFLTGDKLKRKIQSLELQLADAFKGLKQVDEKSDKSFQDLMIVKEDIKSIDRVWKETNKLKEDHKEKQSSPRKTIPPPSTGEIVANKKRNPDNLEDAREPISANDDFRPAVIRPSSIKKYSKYADMGDGFSLSQLSEEPDDEKIFEIDILPNNAATFRVVSNRNAQRFALSNPSYYLDKTCKSDSAPMPGSTIITEEAGKLQLQGNKWKIVNMAKINFT